jgi:hypothetical protein
MLQQLVLLSFKSHTNSQNLVQLIVASLTYGQLVFFFFLIDDGPRRRRYGRIAALKLIVQPCDEDEDYDYFCPFPSNGAPVE